MVGSIYGLTQTVAAVMSSQYRFSRVVFIEWPRDGMVALGFVTGRMVCTDTGASLVVVYVPTVPNPTSGNMAIMVEDDVFETDLTVEDAMKMVFSGGIVLPDSMAFARLPREKGIHGVCGAVRVHRQLVVQLDCIDGLGLNRRSRAGGNLGTTCKIRFPQECR